MGKDMKQFIWFVIVIGFITLLCILYCLTFVCGEEQPDIDTVIVPTECEGVFIEVEYADALDDNYEAADNYPAPPYYTAPTVYVPAEFYNYLGWRTTYREGWVKLVEYGRYRAHGIGAEPPMLDPMIAAASDVAYATYCAQCFVRLSGFVNSPYTIEENALHLVLTCYERERDWTVALAICREESTWGMNPHSRNDFGLCDDSIDMSDPVVGYCDFLDRHCGEQDEMAWILYGGGYNDSGDYKRNILRLSQGIRGEKY